MKKTILWFGMLLAGSLQSALAQGGDHFGDQSWWTVSQFGVGRPAYCYGEHPAQTGIAPTVQEALESFFCSGEHLAGLFGPLVAFDNVRIEIGTGRTFDKALDTNIGPGFWNEPIGSIDPAALVYPLRGSFSLYSCARITDQNTGKNCDSVDQPKATGVCYKQLPSAQMATPLRWRCRLNFAVTDNFGSDQDKKKWNEQWTRRAVPPPTSK